MISTSIQVFNFQLRKLHFVHWSIELDPGKYNPKIYRVKQHISTWAKYTRDDSWILTWFESQQTPNMSYRTILPMAHQPNTSECTLGYLHLGTPFCTRALGCFWLTRNVWFHSVKILKLPAKASGQRLEISSKGVVFLQQNHWKNCDLASQLWQDVLWYSSSWCHLFDSLDLMYHI